MLAVSLLSNIYPNLPFVIQFIFFLIISPTILYIAVKSKKKTSSLQISSLIMVQFLLGFYYSFTLSNYFHIVFGFLLFPYILYARWIRNQMVFKDRKFSILKREQHSILMDMELAKAIQESLFPPQSRIKGLKYVVFRKPYTKLGGDFYDFVRLREGNTGLFLTDVAGHGIPASMIAAMLKVLVASMPYSFKTDPSKFLTFLDERMSKDFPSQHASALYVYIDFQLKSFRVASAGHPYPMFAKKGKDFVEIETEGSILGYNIRKPIASNRDFQYKKGDRLVLFTDGITEFTNSDGKMIDTDGLLRILNEHRQEKNLEEFLEKVIAKIKNFYLGKDFSDDAMLLICELE